MVKVSDIMGIMEKIAPKRLAEVWDNPGLLVGNPNGEVNKILVTLDANERAIDKAVDIGAELIVTHHPIIFKPLKSVRSDLPDGAKLFKLIKHNISVFSVHTNLDSAQGGVNDILAERLNLQNIEPFIINENGEAGLGRIGRLNRETTIEEFAESVKINLNASHIKLVKGEKKTVKKIAVCGGAGAEFINKASFLGADAYVTGDAKYHEGERAKSLNLHLIDAGHFATEYPVVKELANKLKQALENDVADIVEDVEGKDVFTII